MYIDLTTVLVIGLFVAQFTDRGQRFLSTDAGAATFVGIAFLAVFSMLPHILMGNMLSTFFAGMWIYFAAPRWYYAKRFIINFMNKMKRKLK